MQVHREFHVSEPVVGLILIHSETNYSPSFAVDLKIGIDVNTLDNYVYGGHHSFRVKVDSICCAKLKEGDSDK